MTFGCQEQSIDLGKGYKLNELGSFHDLGVTNYNKDVLIKGQILEYYFDSTFIIVIQKPRDSFISIKHLPYNEYTKEFEKNKLQLYWIVEKRKKLVFDTLTHKYSNIVGPFKDNDYQSKLKELKVSRLPVFKKLSR